MIYHKLINHQTNPSKYGYLHHPKDGVCHIHSKAKRNSYLHEVVSKGEPITITQNLYDECQDRFKDTQGNYVILHQRLLNRSNMITHIVKVNENSLTLKADRSNTDPFIFSVSGQVIAYLDPTILRAKPTEIHTEYVIPTDLFVFFFPKSLGEVIEDFDDGSIQDGRVRVLKTDKSITDIVKALSKPTYSIDF